MVRVGAGAGGGARAPACMCAELYLYMNHFVIPLYNEALPCICKVVNQHCDMS